MFSALKFRDFRMLFTGQMFSDTANWLDLTALLVLITYNWEMGPGAVAAMMFTMALPWVLLGPVIAVYADRLPKRSLMFACIILRAGVVAGFIFAPNLYVLLGLVFLKSTLASLFNPARQASLRSLVPKENLPQALSLSQLGNAITQILAPAAGGMLMAATSPTTVFVIEIVFLLLAAVFISRLPKLQNTEKRDAPEYFWVQFSQGYKHVLNSRALFLAIGLMALGFFIVYLYDGLLVIWTQVIGIGQSGYGFVMSAMGAGSVVGALVTGSMKGWKNAPLKMLCTYGAFIGLLNLLIGFGGLGQVTPFLGLWLAVFLVFGTLAAATMITYNYVLQTETPQELMGRVTGLSGAVQTLFMLIAPTVGAFLAKYIEVGGVFVAAGILMAIVAVFGLLIAGGASKAKEESVAM